MSYSRGPLRISGPSQAGIRRGDGGDYAIVEPGGIIIGEAFHRVGEEGYRDAKANAQLWAIAPKLLEALEPFAALYSRLGHLDDDVPLYQRRDVIITVGDIRRARFIIESLLE